MPEPTSLAHAQSLPEVHGSVSTVRGSWLRRLFAFAGPAYLVSVGYMDPGNWATDLEGGARFGYELLWVLVLSNLMALLLQNLSARLGIVTRRDLAQACRDEYPVSFSYVLWILSEIAIVACDLAEVLGAAIGLNLLFKIPILIGVLLTALDTLLILWFTRYGIRVIEACVIVLIATIGGCFGFEIFLAKPEVGALVHGLVPHISSQTLYIAVAILGATVMPHNLYLHSALVQTRQIGETQREIRSACRFNFLDSMLALNAALLVNAAILIVAAAVFNRHGVVVTEIQQAHALLSPILGTTAASIVFGAALLCSGQSSTLTGTMAGQIVMEGFVRFRMQPWLRRSVTRLLAITPAVLTVWFAGEQGTYQLLILSQVILSIQLPFAVVPLIHLTGDRARMGHFVNGPIMKMVSWTIASAILALNIYLAWDTFSSALHSTGKWAEALGLLSAVFSIGLLILLLFLIFWPFLHRQRAHAQRAALAVEAPAAQATAAANYTCVRVPLDHTESDRDAVSNAMALAKSNEAELVLLHIEEGVPSRFYGALASTAEIHEGRDYLEQLAEKIRAEGVRVTVVVKHGGSPAQQIAETAAELKPDLVVMAAHGHRGIKDLIFGSTINKLRHHLKTPMLIVQAKK